MQIAPAATAIAIKEMLIRNRRRFCSGGVSGWVGSWNVNICDLTTSGRSRGKRAPLVGLRLVFVSGVRLAADQDFS